MLDLRTWRVQECTMKTACGRRRCYLLFLGGVEDLVDRRYPTFRAFLRHSLVCTALKTYVVHDVLNSWLPSCGPHSDTRKTVQFLLGTHTRHNVCNCHELVTVGDRPTLQATPKGSIFFALPILYTKLVTYMRWWWSDASSNSQGFPICSAVKKKETALILCWNVLLPWIGSSFVVHLFVAQVPA